MLGMKIHLVLLSVLITLIGCGALILTLYARLEIANPDILVVFIGKIWPLYLYLIFGPLLYYLEKHQSKRVRKKHVR